MNFSDTPCADQYARDLQALEGANFGHKTAVAIATADFNDCMDKTYGPVDGGLQAP